MGQIGETIACTAAMGPRYATRLLAGIPGERFARFATPGSGAIASNHPAFIIGHLCLYPQKAMELIGADATSVAVPSNYEELFSKNATCTDDADGSLYPSSDELINCFESTYETVIDAMRGVSHDVLVQENPNDSPMKKICPTIGATAAFYLSGHVMVHLGQLSAWRRMEGLSPA